MLLNIEMGRERRRRELRELEKKITTETRQNRTEPNRTKKNIKVD